MVYKIFWTDEAIRNLEDILEYLALKWTNREVKNFKMKLSKQIEIIGKNLEIFPVSIFQPRLRKAVLSKQTSIFYEVTDDVIYLVYIFVTYRNPDSLK